MPRHTQMTHTQRMVAWETSVKLEHEVEKKMLFGSLNRLLTYMHHGDWYKHGPQYLCMYASIGQLTPFRLILKDIFTLAFQNPS